MCRRTVIVNLDNGLHLVPCSQIVKAASAFDCTIQIHKGDTTVDAKVIFDLMTLGAAKGTSLEIEASGDRAAEAVDAIVLLFETDFGEAAASTI